MARYTKKDLDGCYYIESVNGKLFSNIFGHTYGEAIDRFAELENAEVVPKSEVERLQKALSEYEETSGLKKAKQDVAREIFAAIESMLIRYTFDDDYISLGIIDEFSDFKKKYTEEKT